MVIAHGNASDIGIAYAAIPRVTVSVDPVLVPTELVAHEAYAHLSTPLLWRFLQEMPAQGDAWAADLLHLNDWHPALALGFLADPPPTVLTCLRPSAS